MGKGTDGPTDGHPLTALRFGAKDQTLLQINWFMRRQRFFTQEIAFPPSQNHDVAVGIGKRSEK